MPEAKGWMNCELEVSCFNLSFSRAGGDVEVRRTSSTKTLTKLVIC